MKVSGHCRAPWNTASTSSQPRDDGRLAQPRVRLLQAPDLPKGWCGKMHAANVLGAEASGRWLLFLDADVRLFRDALSRMLAFMKSTGTALASGVPRQEVVGFLEKLLIPLIHFVLLAFLPMHFMRRSRWKAFGAGCGQLIIVRKDAYEAAGGHAAIKTSRHDGVKLPRAFRTAGFSTLLFDATDVAAPDPPASVVVTPLADAAHDHLLRDVDVALIALGDRPGVRSLQDHAVQPHLPLVRRLRLRLREHRYQRADRDADDRRADLHGHTTRRSGLTFFLTQAPDRRRWRQRPDDGHCN